MKIIKLIIFVFLIVFNNLFAAPYSQDIDSLKSKIIDEGFNGNSLEQYIFYLENNSVKDETGFIELLKNGFEKDLAKAIINYKLDNFNDSYELLLPHLKEKPSLLKYYDYLVKNAGILDKYKPLKDFIAVNINEVEFIYLSGLIDYYETSYKSAEDKFSRALKSKTNSVDILIYLSNTYRRLGDYEKADKTLRSAAGLVIKIESRFAEILIAQGSLYFLSGEYEKAAGIYEKGLEAAKESGNNIEVIKANLNLAMINDLLGDIPKARDLFERSYKSSILINAKELEAMILSELAVSFTYTNEPVEARNKYEESYLLFEIFNNRERIALTAINIASLFLNIGNYKGALDYYNTALEKSGENVRTTMLSYRGLGDVYTNLANYTKALQYYTDAKELSKKIKDISSEAEIDIGIGILFYNLGQPQKALDLLLENYGEIKEAEQPYLMAELDQKAGIIYTSLEEYSKAEKHLSASIDLSDKYGDIYNSILSKTYLAYSYILNNDSESGKRILEEQLKLCREYDLIQLAGVQLLMLSEASSGNKKINYLLEALESLTVSADKSTLTEVYIKIGNYYESNGQPNKAEKSFQKAISIIENQLPVLQSRSDLQINYFSNYNMAYTSLINHYLRNNKIDEAFYVLDKSRSRNTLYNLTGIKLSETNDLKLVNEFYDTNWRLQNNLIDENKSDSIETRLHRIKKELNNKYPNLSNILDINNDQVDFLQPKLFDYDEYFISYFICSDSAYAFVASREKLNLVNLQASGAEILDIISTISPYYNKEIKDKDIHFNKDLFSFNPDNSYRLYKKLLSPVLKEIPKNSELIFSLPNELVIIPFGFLSTGKRTVVSANYMNNKRYLIEDYSISYSPSFSIWKELKTRPQSKEKLALLAGDPSFSSDKKDYAETRGLSEDLDLYSRDIKLLPLKYSAKEIEDIEGYFSNDVVLLKDEATESNFKINSGFASVIHISTHSFLFNNNPVVIFAGDDKNDGYLETGEVAKMQLKSDLVVLSSCKSGLGSKDIAEGILGMQKAFFDAGASSVVLSLWNVSDKHTSTLMKYFYEFLSDGFKKAEALRKAKIKFMEEVNPNPYYWAAFTLAGNSDAIEFENDFNMYAYIFGLLIIISFGYFIFRKKIFTNYTINKGKF